MPANARRAMEEYIKGAEWKTMDYIRPQSFIQADRSFWAICIDNDGHMTGIIPFRTEMCIRDSRDSELIEIAAARLRGREIVDRFDT